MLNGKGVLVWIFKLLCYKISWQKKKKKRSWQWKSAMELRCFEGCELLKCCNVSEIIGIEWLGSRMRKEQILVHLCSTCAMTTWAWLKFCLSKIIVPWVLNVYFKGSIQLAWKLRTPVQLETPVQLLAPTSSRSYLASADHSTHVHVHTQENNNNINSW